MAIRFEDKARAGKPAPKEVNGKSYVAEEPAATSTDPATEQAGLKRKKAARSKAGAQQPA